MSIKKLALSFIVLSLLCIIVLGVWNPTYSFQNKISLATESQTDFLAYVRKPSFFNSWKSNFIKFQKSQKENQYFISLEEEGELRHRLETLLWYPPDTLSIHVQHSFYTNEIKLFPYGESQIMLLQKIEGTGFFENIFLPLISTEIATEYLLDYKKAAENYQ